MNASSRRRSLRIGPRLAAVALACSTLAAVGLPANAQDDPPSPFGESVDVRVVNLEVVVEEKGERVRGLGPEDFVLEVDGREMPIQFFTEVDGGTAVRTVAAAGAAAPSLEDGEAVSTSYLVFVDDFFTEPADRNLTLARLVDQLPLLQVTDQMAVVAFDGDSVDMLSDWTGDVDALARALTAAQERPTHGLRWSLEERTYESNRLRRIRETARLNQPSAVQVGLPLRDPLDPFNAGLGIEERHFASRIEDTTEHAVRSAAAALRGFSQPSGRKVMILLSGGWPKEAASWVVPDIDRRFEQSALLQGNRLLDPLVETANLLGYAIYGVDVPGVDAVGSDASAATVYESESLRNISRLREQEEEFALLEIAEQTGGKALLDGARGDAFARVVEDTRTYYWLGFSPDWQMDDSRHKVRVKVRQKGADVRARNSFSDLSESTRISNLTEGALLFRDAPEALPLTASVEPGQRRGIGKREVPLTVEIPMDQFTYLPSGDGYAIELELRVAVVDENGNRADIPVVPIRYTAERLPEGAEVATYETRVLMRKKQHDMVVSLYDRLSGKVLSTRLTVASL